MYVLICIQNERMVGNMKNSILKRFIFSIIITSIIFSPSIAFASETDDISITPRHLPVAEVGNFDSNSSDEEEPNKSILEYEDKTELTIEEMNQQLEKNEEQTQVHYRIQLKKGINR